jgi:hypothetical protein
LQGLYGAEAGILLASAGNRSYSYGNSLSDNNPITRPLSNKNGLTFGIGANAFAGVEYFVASGIAVGGEVGWGIHFASTGRGKIETESWQNSSVKVETTETGGSSQFGFDNNVNGAITLTFYF